MNADIKLKEREDLKNLEIGIQRTANFEVLGNYLYRGFCFLRVKLPISISLAEFRRGISRFEGIIEVIEVNDE